MTTTTLGGGDYTYRVDQQWAKLPEGWKLDDVASVSVDDEDNVYVFHRGEHPMIVFDRDGNVLDAWGEGLFVRPHGTYIAPDRTIFCTDEGDHTVRQCTLTGKVLLTIGASGAPSGYQSGKPFNRCTDTAMSPEGDIYVSDGYGNSRIHKYSPNGRLILSWGLPGTDPGQFNLPHNVCCDDAGWVYVADRENHRIQIFDGTGHYETQWNNLHRPSGLYIARGANPLAYVGEIGPYLRGNFGWPNVGPRVSILSAEGEVLARLANVPSVGTRPGQFLSPHGISVDSRGDIYVGEVAYTAWPSLFPDTPTPEILPSLKKLVRIAEPQA